MNQDLWMMALEFHGFGLLEFIADDVPDPNKFFVKKRYDMLNFIRNKKEMIFKPASSSKSLKESSIPVMPLELFQGLRPDERRDLFFDSTDRGSVVLLKVVNDALEDKYRCRVLCKEAECMKLDDLKMPMYLPRLQEELNLAGGHVEDNDILRAAVCSVNIDKREMHVTLDSRICQERDVKLGKVPEEEVPSYVGDVKVPECYIDYLETRPEFKRADWADELYNVLGLSRNHVYSFHEELEGLSFPEDECASAIKVYKDQALSMENVEKGKKSHQQSNFTEAFFYFNKALSLYPENVEALVVRGMLYSNINNLKFAVRDTENALKINPNHSNARKQMAVLLINAARKNIELKNYGQAQEALDSAVRFDSENPEVGAVLEDLNNAKQAIVPEGFLNPEPVMEGSRTSSLSPSESSETRLVQHIETIAKKYRHHHRHHRRHHKSAKKSRKHEASVSSLKSIVSVSSPYTYTVE